ncbi:MAG: glutamate-1-semialdehyde 2,1-aminomutase [Desulfobacterales bacterium]|nr:glutamate-1-semialdehyde 2,1-aminomutase [Desulfobacterales bacterium]
MKLDNSHKLFEKAINVIPGGVNSPVRACKSVGSSPLFIERAEGSKIFDADGNSYIDYIGSWGPIILGHRHPIVTEAISNVLSRGTSFGAPTDLEIKLAEMIIEAVPSIEMLRMVNSGTEATMSAIRLARGITKRDTIIKFDGCYHGHADTLLVSAGSGVATLQIPGSPGVPESFVKHTLSLPYNDIECLKKIMEQKGNEIACIIVEPVAGNMGLVKPIDGFLETLRDLTKKYDSLLIFDEVMTGFRLSYGGAQALYGINPDITCLGKIIGGGLPVGAYGGRRDIMNNIAPVGNIYQAGTLSGNPLAMASGIATLSLLKEPNFYKELEKKSEYIEKELNETLKNKGIKATINRAGSMFTLFFSDKTILNFEDAKTCDLKTFSKFYNDMRNKGIYLAPSQFEANFISQSHTIDDINKTIKAVREVL